MANKNTQKITNENIVEINQYNSLCITIVLNINNQCIILAIDKIDLAEDLFFDFYGETGEDAKEFSQLSEEAQEKIEIKEEEIIKYINTNLEELGLVQYGQVA